MTLHRILSIGVMAVLFGGPWCRADQDPLRERGFAPEKSYQIGEVDHINLLNGNLILTIPIGGSYPVGAGFEYSLMLSYNSNVWDLVGQTYDSGQTWLTQALPCRTCNAGLGFLLAIDQLYPPDSPRNSDSVKWLYVGKDGSEHYFYNTLHEGEPAAGGVSYTRDGSYLRMRVTSSGRDIDFPDGTVHSFQASGNDWRVTRIADSFGKMPIPTSQGTHGEASGERVGPWTISR